MMTLQDKSAPEINKTNSVSIFYWWIWATKKATSEMYVKSFKANITLMTGN
jgi:hypothetical protein